MYDNPSSNETVRCSFCGKTQEEVKKIVAGPGVYICNECIDLCKEIIDEEFYEEAVREFTEVPKPLEILEVLNNYVIGQDRAKRSLAVAVYNHYKRVNQQAQENTDDVELQKKQYLLDRTYRVRENIFGTNISKNVECTFCNRRCDKFDRSWLCG